ncbi:hypothetical protein PFISCL1PPCAC_27609, partial [Pristionchus fissidentatus]
QLLTRHSMDPQQAAAPVPPPVGFQQHVATAPPLEPPPAYAEFPSNPKIVSPGGVYPELPHMPNAVPPPIQQQPHPQSAPRPTTVYVGVMSFSSHPQAIHCAHCAQEIVTRVTPKPGLLTYLLCGGLAFFGCWICCCIPFCVEGAQDIEHFCPKCNRFMGTYKRI